MPTVIVVGAGYAGARAAVAARRRGADVVLVDATGNHEFLTRFAGVAGGRVPTGDGWAPAAELLGVEVRRAVVDHVATDRAAVVLDDGATIEGDAVVLAAGAVSTAPPIPGLIDHALSLRSVSDALTIRRQLIDVDAMVIIGAGATGVQLAYEAAARHPHLDVSIVESRERIMPAFDERLAIRTQHLLWQRGVSVELGAEVRCIRADGVDLAGGRSIHGVPVWAGGYRGVGNALLPDAEVDADGRLIVTQTLRVPGTVGVFAAGDIAAHHDVWGRPVPMSAQVADRAGMLAGRNAVRHARGRAPVPAVLVDLGWVIALDQHVGVAEVGPIRLASPGLDLLAPAMHTLVDLKHLFQVGGMSGVLAHAPGQHRPDRSSVVRVERPAIRGVSA